MGALLVLVAEVNALQGIQGIVGHEVRPSEGAERRPVLLVLGLVLLPVDGQDPALHPGKKNWQALI